MMTNPALVPRMGAQSAVHVENFKALLRRIAVLSKHAAAPLCASSTHRRMHRVEKEKVNVCERQKTTSTRMILRAQAKERRRKRLGSFFIDASFATFNDD
jgi:nitrate/nitrite-specific signal transduction histidine kinase